MRWLCACLLCLALLTAAPAAWAVDGPIVTLQARPEMVTTSPGQPVQLQLVLTIAPSFHINGPSAGDAGLIPTKVEISAPPGLSFATPEYPEAKKVRVQFADQPVEMYGGQVLVWLRGKVDRDLKPGVYPVRARASYQACDDMVCHMPGAQEISFKVKVVPR